MPSRLSSLLVRDGLVGVKRMEKAFQRQVIYGGSLDTILLEMNLVPEERLTQYLALASGLPPAARDEGDAIEAAAIALVSREQAQQYRAVPVALEDDAVRVLVCSPLEITELEDLADLIDRPLQPLIVPEYRWNLVYAAAYQVDAPARFSTLARTLDVDPITLPVGRAKTVIVEGGDVARATMPMMPASRGPAEAAPVPAAATPAARLSNPLLPATEAEATMRFEAAVDEAPEVDVEIDAALAPPARDRVGMGTDEIPLITHEGARNRRATIVGQVPYRASTEAGLITPRGPAAGPATGDPPAPSSRTPTPSSGVPATGDSNTDSGASAGSGPARRRAGLQRAQSQPIATEGRDAPLPILRARELLATADDRDTVFLTLLRAARAKARWAGLLTIQGGAAIGRVALAEPTIDAEAIHTVVIPLDVASPFRTAVQSMQPYVGPLSSGELAIAAMLLRFGGIVPPSALILPIVLRDRVVAIVVAHRVLSDTRLSDVTELLPMATAAADALGRLIARTKAAGSRAPADTTAVEPGSGPVAAPRATGSQAGPEAGDTRRGAMASDEAWRAPASPAPRAEGAGPVEDLAVAAAPIRPIDDVLDAIETASEGRGDAAIAEAVGRTQETIGALARRFPGVLRVDRFAVNGRALRAAQYGGLLELVIALGGVAADLLVEKMGAAPRDVRFYATVCCAELRPRSAVFALAERLFDQDFGVRAAAIEALAGYPVGELGQALVRARRALHSTDPEVVGAAAMAVVALGDVEAVGDLIGALARGDRAAEHARRALVALTAQDFGMSERKWRRWYDTAQRRHRIEWLIEGLSHRDDAIREAAINDLRRLTGEYFGYHYDLPRRDRDAAASRWLSWWRDAGYRRFSARNEDERQRPTGVLPARRDRDEP